LQKKPEDRPNNATEVLESLSSLNSEPATLISERISEGDLPRRGRTFSLSSLRSLKSILLPVVVVGAIFLIGLGAWLSRDHTTASPTQRLAVVPFRNLTGDPESQYLAEGLATLLRSRLSALPELRVVGQEASLSLTEAALGDRSDYARDLGVSGVLEGSLQRGAQGLLVIVNFVDAATQDSLWSSEFPVSEGGIPTVPLQIAQVVATRLLGSSPALVQPEVVPSVSSFEDFLRASQTLSRPVDSNSIRTAIALLRQAVEENPDFGLAHLELAKGLLLLHGREPERRLLDEAESLIQDAERLEPDLPEVKAVRAQILTDKGETRAAIALLEETLQQRPDAEELLAQLENSFAVAGSADLAQATLDRLRALGDPQSVTRKLAKLYERSGNLERAEALFREAASSSPVTVQSLQEIASFLLRQSRFDDARTFIDQSLALFPEHGDTLVDLGTLRLFTGNIEGAIEAFDRLEAAITDPVLASNKGTAHYMLGDIGEAEKLYRLASLLEPNDPTLRGNLGDALMQQGRVDAARDEYQEALRLVRNQLVYFTDDAGLRSKEVLFLAKSGQCADAASRIETTVLLVERDAGSLHRLARSAGICQDRDASLRLLARTIEAGIPFETIRQLDDEFRFLSNDAEFLALGSGDVPVR
jgi:Flp pilus assembly protein TadD/TolB-like protein